MSFPDGEVPPVAGRLPPPALKPEHGARVHGSGRPSLLFKADHRIFRTIAFMCHHGIDVDAVPGEEAARKEGAAVARPRRAAGQGNGPRNAEVQSPTATRFLWARRDAFLAPRRHLLPAGEQRRHHVNRLNKTGSSR